MRFQHNREVRLPQFDLNCSLNASNNNNLLILWEMKMNNKMLRYLSADITASEDNQVLPTFIILAIRLFNPVDSYYRGATQEKEKWEREK